MSNFKTIPFLIFTFFIIFQSKGQDSAFKEYKMDEFIFNGKQAKVVYPNKKSNHNYWIWRARFWGTEHQLDKALLEKGFHLVYIDVANMFGNNEAVKLWNSFYKHCKKKYNLNSKVVLEGMSRGGLITYNWASKNTNKVLTIYADAPVCDIKSWPGGLYKSEGNANAWKICLDAYGLDTVSVLNFKNIPIHNCKKIAKAGVPVIHVYGDSDKVVPFEENTALLAKEFEKAGGTIKLISKKGVGHHPHSLKDPKPIVEFIFESIENQKK